MLSSEIFYKVRSIEKDKYIDINNFKYIPVRVTLPEDIKMVIYVSDKRVKYLKEGEYYKAQRAYMTSNYGEFKSKESFGFRVDYIEQSTEEEFNSQDETVVTFNARLGKKPNNVIKYLGPMRIPTYSVKATLKNERSDTFNVLAVGYHSRAKLLNTLGKVCYVDIEGSISAPRKPGMTCAVVVKDLILRKEVEA